MAKEALKEAEKHEFEKPVEIPQAVETPKPAKSSRKLTESRLHLPGQIRNRWDVVAEPGATIDDILNPHYWAHVASKLKPNDILTVFSDGGGWTARLIVTGSDRMWAKVHKLEYHDLTASLGELPAAPEDAYAVEWMPGIAKFAVIRKADRAVLKEGFSKKLEAYQWLDGHINSITP